MGCSEPQKKRDKHYKRALEYIKLADEKSAIIELKNAVNLDPKFADGRYQLGLLYLRTGDAGKAFGELQRATSLDPQNLDAGIKVAEFLLLSSNKEESRKYVEQVLETDPEYQDGLALLANLELIEGNFRKAEEVIDKAISLNNSIDKYYNIRGRVLIAQERFAEGEKSLLKSIELNPNHFANYKTLLLYYEQRQNESAVQQLLDHMTRKFPENPQLHLMLARLHQQRGELIEAEQAYVKAKEQGDNSISYWLLLTEFYKDIEQYEQAEQTLQSALEAFPEDLQAQVSLGDLLFDLRKFDEAQKILDDLLESNPANGGANLLKARFLIKDQQYNEALEIITPLLTDYPKWSDPFYFSALCHLRIGKPELAQKSIELAIQNAPAKDRYRALAAQIHLVRGNSSEAGKEASNALRINPRNFVAAKILTQSFNQSKEFDKAIKLLGNISPELVERDPELLESLAMAHLGKGNREEAKKTLEKLLRIEPGKSKALALLLALKDFKDIPAAVDFVTGYVQLAETAGHYLLLGDLQAKGQEFEKALAAYHKAQTLQPTNPKSYILAARLLARLGKTENAAAKYKELLEIDPNSIPALLGLGSTYEYEGKLEMAKETYRQILQINPSVAAAANNLAWLIASEEGGDLGEALRLAMQAKQELPDQPHVADTLGWVHYKRGSYPLAITQFTQALEKRPNDPVIQYHLALALRGNNKNEEAMSILQEILQPDVRFQGKESAAALYEEMTAK